MTETLTAQEFAGRFNLNPCQFAWFLGAGASAASGIPTGYAMINDFKKKLFCNKTNVSPRQVDSDDPLWKQRINKELQSVLPPPGDPSEYAAAFEAVFPTGSERRLYIEEQIRKGAPSFGHKLLAALICNRSVPCIFTTNFDPLIENAVTVIDSNLPPEQQVRMTVAALDNAERAERCIAEQKFPLLAKLHGDFQSIQLKNTSHELRDQDERMRRVLMKACTRYGLIVIGYSGRDASIMNVLNQALEHPSPYPGGLVWVARSEQSLLPAVSELLKNAAAAGVTTRIVVSKAFDEFAGDIFDVVNFPLELSKLVQKERPTITVREVPLPTQECRKFPILQCSAVPILEMPTQARRLTLKTPTTTQKAREMLQAAGFKQNLVAATGQTVAAFGSDKDLLSALSTLRPEIDSTIELNPEADGWALGLLYDALVRAVCRGAPLIPCLRKSGHYIIVSGNPQQGHHSQNMTSLLRDAYATSLTGTIPSTQYEFNEGVQIRLEQAAGRWWLVFNPFTSVSSQDKNDKTEASPVMDAKIADWRRERWAKRRNESWEKILGAWSQVLSRSQMGSKDAIAALGITDSNGVDARFTLSSVPAWSRPANDHNYFLRR